MDALTLALAERLARSAHSGQKDKAGAPYIHHVARVVQGVGADLDLQAVAWLHDVLEDTPMQPGDLVAAGIPVPIVEAVTLLTRGPERYKEYIEELFRTQHPLAVPVKMADLRDHLRADSPYVLPSSARRRYQRALDRLS